jgi:hypothetical protein
MAPTSPYVLDVKDDGRYGITLVPRNGLGVCRQPPLPGELPQAWVEVDTTRPVVRIGQISFVVGEQAKVLSITWVAEDRNLGSQPVRLSYADKPQGPWRMIAQTENGGYYLWRLPPQMPGSFFVRVEATDTAGNVGFACTAEPIVLDVSQPSIDILSVEANRKR